MTIQHIIYYLTNPQSPVFFLMIFFVVIVAIITAVAMKGCQYRIFTIFPIIIMSMFSKTTKSQKVKNRVSTLKTTSLSLASRAGIGNIIGVGFGVLLAGPGILFWMVIFSFVTISTSFSECMLANAFKKQSIEHDSLYVGGPMYMAKYHFAKVWKWYALLLAIITFVSKGIFIGGTTISIITQTSSWIIIKNNNFDFNNWKLWLFAIVISSILFISIIKGARGIVSTTSKFGFTFLIVYFLFGSVIFFSHLQFVGPFIEAVFKGAFNPHSISKSIPAGFASAFFVVMNYGFYRGIYGNEAGQGSSTFASGVADPDHPARIGAAQSFVAFLDIIITCVISGFIFSMIEMLGITGTINHYQVSSNISATNWHQNMASTIATFNSNNGKDITGVALFGIKNLLWGYGQYVFGAFIFFFGYSSTLGAIMIAEFCLEWMFFKYSKKRALLAIKIYSVFTFFWMLLCPFILSKLGDFAIADLCVVICVILEGILLVSMYKITSEIFLDYYLKVKNIKSYNPFLKTKNVNFKNIIPNFFNNIKKGWSDTKRLNSVINYVAPEHIKGYRNDIWKK